jgi:hypothetical protein
VDKRYRGDYIGAHPRETGGAVRRGSAHDAWWTPLWGPLGARAAGEAGAGWVSSRWCRVEDSADQARLVRILLFTGALAWGCVSGQWSSAARQRASTRERVVWRGKACSNSGQRGGQWEGAGGYVGTGRPGFSMVEANGWRGARVIGEESRSVADQWAKRRGTGLALAGWIRFAGLACYGNKDLYYSKMNFYSTQKSVEN